MHCTLQIIVIVQCAGASMEPRFRATPVLTPVIFSGLMAVIWFGFILPTPVQDGVFAVTADRLSLEQIVE